MKEESGCNQTTKDIEEIEILSTNEEMRTDIVVIDQIEAAQHNRAIAIKKAEAYLDGQKYDRDRLAAELGAQFTIAANAYVEIGKRLLAVKLVEGHGNFLQWLQSNFALSPRTANNFMFVAEKISKRPELAAFAKAGPSKALALLDLPEEYQEEYVLEGTINGEPLDDLQLLSRDELRARIKKLQNNEDRLVSEETRALKAENEDLIEENKLLKRNQSSGPKTPEWLEEQFKEVEKHVTISVSLMSQIIGDERLEFEAHILAKLEQPIIDSQRSLERCLRYLDQSFEQKGN